MIKKGKNAIVDKSFDFSIAVIAYCDELETKRKYVIARQLLKSATSIGANSREAQNAESKADFIHKLKIALKECEETDYWLTLCDKANNYPSPNRLIELNAELWKLLTSIISKTKRNIQLANSRIG